MAAQEQRQNWVSYFALTLQAENVNLVAAAEDPRKGPVGWQSQWEFWETQLRGEQLYFRGCWFGAAGGREPLFFRHQGMPALASAGTLLPDLHGTPALSSMPKQLVPALTGTGKAPRHWGTTLSPMSAACPSASRSHISPHSTPVNNLSRKHFIKHYQSNHSNKKSFSET